MNNTRKTVDVALYQYITANMPAWQLFTGDEPDPTLRLPAVVIMWVTGEMESPLIAAGFFRLFQIDVVTNSQDSSGEDDACLSVLIALNLRLGTQPKAILPKQSWTLDGSGNPVGTPLGSNIILKKMAGKGWHRIDPPQQQIRRQSITLEAHYLPG